MIDFEDFDRELHTVPDGTHEASLVRFVRGIASAQMRFFARQDAARPSPRAAAYRLLKCMAIPDAHQVVEDGIDGGAEVIQTAAQDVQPLVQVRIVVGALRVDVEQTLGVKRRPANEKHDHHRA